MTYDIYIYVQEERELESELSAIHRSPCGVELLGPHYFAMDVLRVTCSRPSIPPCAHAQYVHTYIQGDLRGGGWRWYYGWGDDNRCSKTNVHEL